MAALAGADPLVVVGLSGDAARLETARRLGATHLVNVERDNLDDIVRGLNPLGADLVCDASGASRPLDVALALARPDGQVTKVGWSPTMVITPNSELTSARIMRMSGGAFGEMAVKNRAMRSKP